MLLRKKKHAMDDSLRQWIASNLRDGRTVDQLRSALVESGVSAKVVEQELSYAAPYVAAIAQQTSALTRLNKKLSHSNGLFKLFDQQLRHTPRYLDVEKVKLPPFRQFMDEYYYPHRIGHFTDALEHCAAKHWTLQSIVEKVGADAMVEVRSETLYNGDSFATYYTDADAREKRVRFGDYMDTLEHPESGNKFYIPESDYNNTVFSALKEDIWNFSDGYLADKNEGMANGYSMGFFIGHQGAVTALHYDLFNNLFIQTYGKKLIRLIPSLQTPYVRNDGHHRFSDIDLLKPDLELYPEFANTTVIEIEVVPGDAIFIPVGWWHHVTYLTASISVTFSNLNVDSHFKDYRNFFGKDF